MHTVLSSRIDRQAEREREREKERERERERDVYVSNRSESEFDRHIRPSHTHTHTTAHTHIYILYTHTFGHSRCSSYPAVDRTHRKESRRQSIQRHISSFHFGPSCCHTHTRIGHKCSTERKHTGSESWLTYRVPLRYRKNV